jgi:hypothetical protein
MSGERLGRQMVYSNAHNERTEILQSQAWWHENYAEMCSLAFNRKCNPVAHLPKSLAQHHVLWLVPELKCSC